MSVWPDATAQLTNFSCISVHSACWDLFNGTNIVFVHKLVFEAEIPQNCCFQAIGTKISCQSHMTVQVVGDNGEIRFVHIYLHPNSNHSVCFKTDNEHYLSIPQYMHTVSQQQVYLTAFASGSHHGHGLLLFLPHVRRELQGEAENLLSKHWSPFSVVDVSAYMRS